MSLESQRTRQLQVELNTLQQRIIEIECQLQDTLSDDPSQARPATHSCPELSPMDIFQAVFENVADGIVVADVQSRKFILCNPTFARMIGRELHEITSLGVADIHPASDLPRVQEAFQNQADGLFTLAEDIPVLRADGSILYTDVNSFPVSYKQRQCLMGVFRDITRRKQALTLLEESERKYRTLVESASASIVVVDKAGVFCFLNHMAAESFHGGSQDLMGKTMWDLFPREVADRQMATICRVIESGKRESEISLTVIGSENRWYDTTIEPLKGDNDVIDRVLIVARDIHEYKKAEEHLAKYREDMIRAEHLASLGTLSAMLAHELNQPLTVIRLSLENTLAHLDSSQQNFQHIKEDLDEGLSEVANVINIVNRFRDFAKRSSERPMQPVNIWTMTEKVFDLLGSLAEQFKVSLQSEGLRALPDLMGDAQDITQLLFSLIENAIQAADGQRLHTVVVKGTVNGDTIELHVRDDCGGIDNEHLSRIFEPFFTTKQDSVSTGLGLCVVERIVEHIGGTIRIESQWGKGSDFIITLPVRQD